MADLRGARIGLRSAFLYNEHVLSLTPSLVEFAPLETRKGQAALTGNEGHNAIRHPRPKPVIGEQVEGVQNRAF